MTEFGLILAVDGGGTFTRCLAIDKEGAVRGEGSGAIRELGMEAMAVPVSYVGSVFESGQLIIDSFSAALQKTYPLATVAPPEFPAVIGAFFPGGTRSWLDNLRKLP